MRRSPVLVRAVLGMALALLTLPAAPALAQAPAPATTVPGVLDALRDAGAIDPARHDAWRAIWDDSGSTLAKLSGRRRVELGAVRANVAELARRGTLTPSRAPLAFLTLDRNRQWWSTRELLPNGARVVFKGSELVWQSYVGQGLQIQWLGTFGRINGLWEGRKYDKRLAAALAEARALATDRAGGIAWEYAFRFDGGAAFWVSGLAEGTAVQAYARGAQRLGDPALADIARAGLGIFRTAPPGGVAVPTPAGTHYLQYSFTSKLRILNGFVQALNGLHDYAAITGDPDGRALFAAGDAELRAELPAYDTGAWSLYAIPGHESDLNYHRLLRDFLRRLCDSLRNDGTDATPYCDAADRFTGYLTTPPVVGVDEEDGRARKPVDLHFVLSKVSMVTITVARQGRVVFSRQERMGFGDHVVRLTPRDAGPHQVQIRAVDLAGNAGAGSATLHVRPAAPAKAPRG